jgi:hypothetical protein
VKSSLIVAAVVDVDVAVVVVVVVASAVFVDFFLVITFEALFCTIPKKKSIEHRKEKEIFYRFPTTSCNSFIIKMFSHFSITTKMKCSKENNQL